METLILAVHMIVALMIIVLVMLQQGKGADMGAAFGSGASGSLFGASGSANFLSRATAVAATVFFITSLSLAYFSGSGVKSDSVMKRYESGVIDSDDKQDLTDAIPSAADTVDDGSKAKQIPE